MRLGYDNWSYEEILEAIMPAELLGGVPTSFTVAGHVVHLNLRAAYLPYKTLIAQLILDKNPNVRTVVNKLEDVGADSVFRTFPMEVLAGDPDTCVEVKEAGCVFAFDFAKVYWNTRLGHEHERVVAKFAPGEAVCDVMAGVGPFAVPAGKKEVFVWANDLNPESFAALQENISRNKTDPFVTPFNLDGRHFIRQAVHRWYHERYLDPAHNPAVLPGKRGKYSRTKALAGVDQTAKPRMVPLPKTFAHFVMNLPASAVEFLDGFIGAYKGLEHMFEGDDAAKMPYIHVHTFHRETFERGEDFAKEDVVAELERYLECSIDPETVELHSVRRVAPNKGMYCASFQLPKAAAFAELPSWARGGGDIG